MHFLCDFRLYPATREVSHVTARVISACLLVSFMHYSENK